MIFADHSDINGIPRHWWNEDIAFVNLIDIFNENKFGFSDEQVIDFFERVDRGEENFASVIKNAPMQLDVLYRIRDDNNAIQREKAVLSILQ